MHNESCFKIGIFNKAIYKNLNSRLAFCVGLAFFIIVKETGDKSMQIT